ncbi:MAG: cytochrome P450 [Ktedonobacterales bacterium]
MGKPLHDAPLTSLSAMDIFSGAMPERLAREAEELGPLFRWPLPSVQNEGRQAVFLIGAEANRLVFNTQREAFSHDLGWTPIIGDLMGQGLLNQDNPAWLRSRKIWNPAFTAAYMETYLPTIQRIVREHTDTWAERDQVDVFQEARQITFHVAATALAGIDHPDEVEHLQKLFYDLLPRAGTFIGDDGTAYAEYERAALAARQELDSMLLQLIAQRRKAPKNQTHDVLGLIVHTRDEGGQTLTDEEVLAHLYILLVAGHETTTTLAAWTLYLLATEPTYRQSVLAEVRGQLAGSSGPLSVEGARNLHQLDLFIREAGRLHSPVQSVPRGVVKETEFAGYTLPVGTSVRLSIAGCHRMPRYFADPNRFDPDRFLPPREEDRRSPYALVTFGGGPRLCIGVNFANIEVKAIAADVLRRYELSPVNDELPLDMGFITVLVPGGIPMRAHPRNS